MIISDHKGKLPAMSLNSSEAVYIGKLSVSLHLNKLELKIGYKTCHKFIQSDQNDSSFFSM